MDDLISRQAAIDAIADYLSKTTYTSSISHLNTGALILAKVPSAQSERKTGRWILYENQRQEDVDNDNYLYICSECGKSDLHAKTQKVPFCWNCGSRMDGEEDG